MLLKTETAELSTLARVWTVLRKKNSLKKSNDYFIYPSLRKQSISPDKYRDSFIQSSYNAGHLSEIPQTKEIKASEVNRLQWILTKSLITEQGVISESGRYFWTP